MANPKMKTKVFQPGLEIEHEVGLTGVGVTIVHTTVAVNTARTAAQLLASAPNTDLTRAACGPVVHSLGAPPSFSFMTPVVGAYVSSGPHEAAVTFRYVTADNSAVYFFPACWTGAADGLAVRVVAVR